MKLFVSIALCFGLLLVSTATAAAQEHTPYSSAVVEEQARAYGSWLSRLHEVQQPMLRAYAALAPYLLQAQSLDRDTERAHVRREFGALRQILPRVEADLAGLGAPSFPALDLNPTLAPAALLRDARLIVRTMGSAANALLALDEAVSRRNGRAMLAAERNLEEHMSALQAALITITRAQLAGTPRGITDWEAISLKLEFLQAARRILPANRSRQDRTLSADLLTIADRVGLLVRTGRVKLRAEISVSQEQLRLAQARGDAAVTASFRREGNMLAIMASYFDLFDEFERLLRSVAERARDGRLTGDLLTVTSGEFTVLGARIDELTTRFSAALAGR